jgi:hydrogenase maturation protease
MRPILVATCGNASAGDDAFGPRVAALLRENDRADLEVVDLGMKPAALLDHLEGRQMLVIVDAAAGQGLPPGLLIDTDWWSADRPPLVSERSLSTHGISLADQIELAGKLHLLPRIVRVIAATGAAMTVGAESSPSIDRLVAEAAHRIRHLLVAPGPQPQFHKVQQSRSPSMSVKP